MTEARQQAEARKQSQLSRLLTEAYEAGRREENEACAKLMESQLLNEAEALARAIRERMEPK